MHDDVWREKRWHFEALRCIDSSCIDIDDIDGTDTDIDVDILVDQYRHRCAILLFDVFAADVLGADIDIFRCLIFYREYYAYLMTFGL